MRKLEPRRVTLLIIPIMSKEGQEIGGSIFLSCLDCENRKAIRLQAQSR